MSHVIDTVLEPVLWWMADWSLRWAVLIGVVGGWLMVLRPRKVATCYLICLMALVAGLAIPIAPRWSPVPEGVSAWLPHLSRTPDPPTLDYQGRTADIGTGPAMSEFQAQNVDPEVSTEPKLSAGPANPLPVPPAVEDVAAPPANQFAVESLGTRRLLVVGLAGVWTGGVVFLLIRWACGWWYLNKLRRSGNPLLGTPANLFDACRVELKLRRRATLATHPAVRSPITLGLYRPVILVPPTWSELPEPVQRGSLLHELAHLARYDDWWALLLELVRAVFFFHPCLRWLLVRLERERELLCDEAAVARGIDPCDLVRMLLEWSRQPGRLTPAFLGQSYSLRFGNRRTVKTRIHHLLEENMDRWLSPLPFGRALALAALVLGLAVGLGSIQIQAVALEEKPPQLKSSDPAPVPQQDAQKEKPTGTFREGRTELEREGDLNVVKPYRIEPFNVLQLVGQGTLPNEPVIGFYLVEPDGRIDLGPRYGKVSVAGLTIDEAIEGIEKRLRELARDPKVSVTMVGWVTKWQADSNRKHPYRIRPRHVLVIDAPGMLPGVSLGGSHVVDLDGKINLGPGHGKIKLAGLTLDEAADAIEKHFAGKRTNPKVAVKMSGWEKDWQRLEDEDPPPTKPRSTSKIEKGALRYGGKDFNQWRRDVITELKPEVRVEGIKAFSVFGIHGYGREAVDAILEIMRGYDVAHLDTEDSKVSDAAHGAVAKIGSAAFAPLVKELKSGPRNGNRFAATALAEVIGTPSRAELEAAAPVLLTAAKADDVYVRRQVLNAIYRQKAFHEVKEYLPTFIGALKDDNVEVRGLAANALQTLGPKTKAAVPALVEAIRDNNSGVRSNVIAALYAIGPEPKVVLPALIAALNDEAKRPPNENRSDRWGVLRMLGKMGPEAKDAVPALIAGLQIGPPEERLLVVETLGQIGPAAKEAISHLTALLKSEDRQLRSTVNQALKQIDK